MWIYNNNNNKLWRQEDGSKFKASQELHREILVAEGDQGEETAMPL